jgi:acetyl esterase/lipase
MAVTPAAAQEIQISKSIAYAGGPRHSLDVYRPAGVRRAPVIVFLYGGSWQNGAKSTYSFVGEALARRGYVTIVPDYRVYPTVRIAGMLEDGAQAVRWARDNAARFGGDPNVIYLMGHSAGAYNSAMLAFDGRWLKGAGLSSQQIKGFIGVSGPYDFLPLKDRTLAEIFGGANRADTQPINYVSRRSPPALLATGTFDTTVDPANSTRLADRMRAAGNDVTLRRYPAVGHVTILGGFGTPIQPLVPVLDDVDKFVRRTSGARSGD